MTLSNRYAPEHLILNLDQPRRWLDKVENAGSDFLGPWSPEAIGDYCSGTNHVLPHVRSRARVERRIGREFSQADHGAGIDDVGSRRDPARAPRSLARAEQACTRTNAQSRCVCGPASGDHA